MIRLKLSLDIDPHEKIDEEEVEDRSLMFEDHLLRVKDMLCIENSTKYYLIWEVENERPNEIENEDETKVGELQVFITMEA